MPGRQNYRFRTLVVLGALALFAVAPSLAPAIAAKGGGAKGGDAAPKGAIGVQGVSQASPGFAQAQQAVAGERAPISTEPTGLEAKVGSLPFTGWDLIILGGVATMLTGIGFMLHRLSTPRAPYA